MKKAVAAVIVAGLALGGLFWWRTESAATTPETEAPTLEAAKRGPIRQTVDCNGRIVSNLDVEIKCRASGEIVKLPFDISDPVKKGDLLLELDPKDQERLLQQAQATLHASEARLAQAENNLDTARASVSAGKLRAQAALEAARARLADVTAKAKREEELLAKKFSSPEEYETAKTAAVQAEQDVKSAEAQLEEIRAQELDLRAKEQEIKLSKAQVESNRISVDLAERQLGYTQVYSPIDGVVAARNVQIGQIISSGISNVGGGTTALIVSDLSRIFILASVDESDIGSVKLGQQAEVTADAYPRVPFTGVVDRIATKGVNLQNVVTFEVRIEITSDNKDLLRPEMTANVQIVVAESPDSLLVPATSIVRDKRETFVTLVKAGNLRQERHPVTVGITNGEFAEILSGLSEGDVVEVRRPEDESRWRNAGGPDQRSRERVMMRALGGGSRR